MAQHRKTLSMKSMVVEGTLIKVESTPLIYLRLTGVSQNIDVDLRSACTWLVAHFTTDLDMAAPIFKWSSKTTSTTGTRTSQIAAATNIVI